VIPETDAGVNGKGPVAAGFPRVSPQQSIPLPPGVLIEQLKNKPPDIEDAVKPGTVKGEDELVIVVGSTPS
jgi:hypothetical protein